MHPPSSTLNAAIRAMRGESNLDAVRPALEKEDLARVIACASETNRIVRALAALRGRLPALLDTPTIADPALHDAVARMIGTPEGESVLRQWAQIVPAGWGAEHAVALVNAVTNETCSAGVAAALIGPCDQSAALLHDACEITFAIRRWGQSSLDTPTAWMHALSVKERDRLIDVVQREPYDVAISLPWLPSGMANQTNIHDYHLYLYKALYAFAEASPTTWTHCAEIMQRLVAQANQDHLDALTRLACATQAEAVWARVAALIQKYPGSAPYVVIAAPWDDLSEAVREAILKSVDQSPAIGVARGRQLKLEISQNNASEFFAALTPKVWDALDSDKQRAWRLALWKGHAHLTVRALGPRPEFLAQAILDNNLVRAVQRHTRDDATLRWALLPVALRDLSPDKAHALITALPTPPPDPSAFFCIACGKDDLSGIASACTALHTLADLALAIALQRSGDHRETIVSCCTALQHALDGRSWHDLTPIMPLLESNAYNVLTPHLDFIAARLAHPNRHDALCKTLARIASLPPKVAVPIWVALNRWKPLQTSSAAEAVALTLRSHGDLFLEIADALDAANLRPALLPLPDGAEQANALRDLARDDPPTAHRLAHALRDRSWIAALHALLTASPRHADVIWQALPDDVRSKMVAAVAAATSDIDPIFNLNSIAALALAAVRSGDIDLQNKGLNVLTTNPDLTRTIWDALPQKTQQALRDHLAFTDLSMTHARSDEPSASRHWRR